MTLYSLFWCMFGQISTDSVIITYPAKPTADSRTEARLGSLGSGGGGRVAGDGATTIVESVGLLLFAVYHVTAIIVLVNMLIAMMSHSFEDIQVSQTLSKILRRVQSDVIPHLHNQAGSMSWLYVSWTSQLDVCSIVQTEYN